VRDDGKGINNTVVHDANGMGLNIGAFVPA
jgi:hypothetical protein